MELALSDHAIGAVLAQKDGAIENAVYYISKNIQGAELIYTITKKRRC